ncbi:MAG: hypothetical protein RLZZ303_2261 [Candidatus Hydrogenedentota bacterium]|jgi:hypothetical protein
MSRPNLRGRADFGQDTLTAEFTTGQIVIMACAALGVACLMFALGVLVGRFDPTQPAPAAVAEAPAEESAGETPPAAPMVVAGTTAAPKTEAPAATATPPSAVAVEAAPAKTPEDKPAETTAPEATPPATTAATPPNIQTATLSESVRPRITKVEPLPLGVGGVPATPASGTPPLPTAEVPKPEASVQVEPAPTKPESKPAETSTTPPAKVSEMDNDALGLMEPMPDPPTKVAEAKPADAAPATAAPAAAPNGPIPGKYAVQIMSFTMAGGPKRAEDYAANIRSAQGLDARVTPSRDGKSYSVVVVGYTDKAAADRACKQLKQQPGFKDAWVRAL